MSAALAAFAVLCVFGAVLGIVVALCIAIRNELVYRYRGELIDAVAAANERDIRAGRYELLSARWRWYDSVPYNAMVIRFWRSLDSFYGPMPGSEDDQ